MDGPPGYGAIYDYEYFSGDGRGYSSDIHASSRMHSEVEITGVNTEQPQISFQWHNCGESHALDSSLNIVDTIQTRRSIRKYLQEPLDQADLRTILRLAGLAPSLANIQPWRFVVIQNKALQLSLRAVANDPALASSLASHGVTAIRARHTCRHRVEELLAIVAGLQPVKATELS